MSEWSISTAFHNVANTLHHVYTCLGLDTDRINGLWLVGKQIWNFGIFGTTSTQRQTDFKQLLAGTVYVDLCALYDRLVHLRESGEITDSVDNYVNQLPIVWKHINRQVDWDAVERCVEKLPDQTKTSCDEDNYGETLLTPSALQLLCGRISTFANYLGWDNVYSIVTNINERLTFEREAYLEISKQSSHL